MYITYDRSKTANPLIFSLLTENGYDITDECIKMNSQPYMSYSSVLVGVNHVKSIGKNILVYTNKVSNKHNIAKENDITILDIDDIIMLCEKSGNIELLGLCFN